MQVVSCQLAKRSRYYHSQMDMELLVRGQDYEQLPSSYVIFICDFDPFHLKRYCYTFENICLEDYNLKLSDGNHTIFLSTKGENPQEISKELFNFLTFVRENDPGNRKNYHDTFIAQLQHTITQIKHNREMGSRYMLLQLMLRDEYRDGQAAGFADGQAAGFADGQAAGFADGQAVSVLEILEELGCVPESLRSFILKQKDTHILKDMIKKASKAASIDQFMEDISFHTNK